MSSMQATLASRFGIVALAGIAVFLTIACGGSGTTATPTERATATQPAAATLAPTPTAAVGNESGQPPILWRTADNFQSLQVGQPYKVLFRITSGYSEPTLRVTAICQTCSTPGQQEPLAFESQQATPGGGEAAGAYYPLNITLPFAGTWQITVVAGSDQAKITVEAAGASSG